MTRFNRIAMAVLGVLLFGVGLSLALPGSYRVERSIEIDAPAEKVFSRIGSLHAWSTWTLWAENDPQTKVTLSDPATGPGAWQRWDCPETGRGSLTFTRFEPPNHLEYEFTFEDFSMQAKGEVHVEPREGGVRVTWIAEGDRGFSPPRRWFGFSFDRKIAGDFEGGLKRLKTACECVGP